MASPHRESCEYGSERTTGTGKDDASRKRRPPALRGVLSMWMSSCFSGRRRGAHGTKPSRSSLPPCPFPVSWGASATIPARRSVSGRKQATPLPYPNSNGSRWSAAGSRNGETPLPQRPYRVAVVGGGLSSLTVAWDLALKGYQVTILRGGRPAGRMAEIPGISCRMRWLMTKWVSSWAGCRGSLPFSHGTRPAGRSS